jgi:non-ribosomal peptide synthetase component F
VTVLLHDLLARAAETRPGSVAIAEGGARLIYSEVATASSRLAATLVRHGVAPGDRVGLLAPMQAEAVVAAHAVVKAGAVYVPLDPGDPAERLARIVCRTGLRMMLSVPAAGARLADAAALVTLPPIGSLTTAPIADLGGRAMSAFTRVEWDTPAPSPSRRGVATDPACLLVTPPGAFGGGPIAADGTRANGSSNGRSNGRSNGNSNGNSNGGSNGSGGGRSNGSDGDIGDGCGVVLTHHRVLWSVERLLPGLDLGPDDRVSGHAPLHSGLSTLDVFGAFAAGAELHLVPPTLDRDLRRLVELMRDRELTQWSSLPSVLSYVARFDALRPGELPALQRVLWTGALPPTTLRYWTERLPHVRFTELRGVPGTDVVSAPGPDTARPGRPRERAKRADQRRVAVPVPQAQSSASS